jgi:hypothetical protein
LAVLLQSGRGQIILNFWPFGLCISEQEPFVMVLRALGTWSFHRWLAVGSAVALCLTFSSAAVAQVLQRQVAGVWVDANNILRTQERDETNELAQARQRELREVPGDLREKTDLRKISLRRLEEAIAECSTNNKPLPDEIKYLAGIQRIRYVFVYPEQQDIVLAGPGEGWKINQQGEVVGITTGRPVMLLDDLLVALRSAEAARREGISCSIDPTSEGLVRLQNLVRTIKQMEPGVTEAIEQTLGPQTISTTGVPADSHFARVIVAADYKMKRLAMKFDESPVRGMPSYLDMIGGGGKGMKNMLPRWWLAPNYDSLLVDADGLAWEFRAAGVKCVAEEDLLTNTGDRARTGKPSPLIKKWADTMTAKYEELSAKDAVFGQLRNCIDLAVVAALISKERLTEKSGYSFGILLDDGQLPVAQFNAPKQVNTIASVVPKGTSWVISASGGVQIESWAMIEKPETAESLAPVREKAVVSGKNWWWN